MGKRFNAYPARANKYVSKPKQWGSGTTEGCTMGIRKLFLRDNQPMGGARNPLLRSAREEKESTRKGCFLKSKGLAILSGTQAGAHPIKAR